MRKFIEYTVKAILIVLVLLGYQALFRYTNGQYNKTFQLMWDLLGYAVRIGSYIFCGMILAYNEHKSGKAGLTKFVLLVIAIGLVAYPFSSSSVTFIRQNAVMMKELTQVMALTFGILLMGIKL